MQIGIGISLTGGGRVPFSLASLFASASGFDFTDLDVTKTWGADAAPLMRKDATGLLVTASGDTVASVLDKSAGFALGAELITSNTDFSSGTGWSFDAGWAVSGGKAVHTAGSAGDAIRSTAPVNAVGDMIRAKVTVSNRTAGGVNVKEPFNHTSALYQTNGDYIISDVAASANAFRYAGNSAFDGSLDDVSMKKVAGNAARQGTSASRPTWQANSGKPYFVPDASDDSLLTTLLPAASMTMVAAVRVAGASQNIMGSTAAANADRCYIATDSAGKLAGGWGNDSTSTIVGGSDITGADHIVMMVASAAGVRLLLDGTLIYSGAANGTANTTVPIALMARNVNGTMGAFMGGRLYPSLAVQQAVSQAQEVPLMRAIRELAGLTSAIPF